MRLKVDLSFYGRKMQPIRSRAILSNTLATTADNKMKPTLATHSALMWGGGGGEQQRRDHASCCSCQQSPL